MGAQGALEINLTSGQGPPSGTLVLWLPKIRERREIKRNTTGIKQIREGEIREMRDNRTKGKKGTRETRDIREMSEIIIIVI